MSPSLMFGSKFAGANLEDGGIFRFFSSFWVRF